MNDLTKALEDIASPLKVIPPIPEAGPSAWSFVKDDPSKFGPEHDFYVEGHVFFAVSEAALNWCYAKLPENIDRFNVTGFVIGSQWIDFIIQRAKQDKLMSREDYKQAMEESSQLAHQWDNQND